MKKNINMRKMKWFVIGVVMLCLLSGVLWESLLQRTLQEYQVEGAGVMDVLAVNAHMKDAVVLESEEDFQSVLGRSEWNPKEALEERGYKYCSNDGNGYLFENQNGETVMVIATDVSKKTAKKSHLARGCKMVERSGVLFVFRDV